VTLTFNQVVEDVGKGLDGAGVFVIVVGVIVAALGAGADARAGRSDTYRRFRQQLGRSILLGLELLVAADIVRTVAVTPTLASVGVLGLIVLIRTFLSFSLDVEITGSWPWQKPGPPSPPSPP
jgi:uncharacterized membrane protein